MDVRRAVVSLALVFASGSWASAQVASPAPPIAEVTTAPDAAAEPVRARPRLLMPMYAMHFTLQGLDVHSTVQALEAGHREANPVFASAKPGHMIGAKLAASAATVWISEKLWKKNRVAAVLVMAGVNAGLSVVVANNYRLARQGRD